VSGAEIAVVLVAAAFASVVKSITGTGYPLVLIPVLALFGDVADAVVLVALPNLWLNGSLIWQARAAWSEASADLTRFLAASVVGGGLAQIVVLGAQGRFTPEILGLAVGLILMVLVLFPLGVRLRERLDVDTFERVVIGLLILSAISLLVRAL